MKQATASASPGEPTPLPTITQKLMDIMDELQHLLEEEIPLIKNHHYDAQNILLKRKHELTSDYNAAMQSLAANVNSLSVKDRALLKNRGASFDAVAKDNAETLRLAHNATERLLSVMMDEVRKKAGDTSGYSQLGNMAALEKSTMQPVAYNRRV